MKSSPALIACLVGLSLATAHAVSDVSVTTAATSGGTFSGGNPNVFTPTVATAVVNPNDILATLNTNTPVTVNTASPALGNGDLRLTSFITRTVGGQALLTFNAAATTVIDHSTNLTFPWTPAVHGTGGVTIVTTPVDAQTEQVTVTIPTSSDKRFVRLKTSR